MSCILNIQQSFKLSACEQNTRPFIETYLLNIRFNFVLKITQGVQKTIL